jgi:type IV pilus assembly protein PilE
MRSTQRNLVRGFTLIELIVVMSMIAILTAMALPSYSEYLARSRRTDARATLTLASQWMERFRAENRGVYLGAELPAPFSVSPNTGTALYEIQIAAVTAATYRIEATPRITGPMSGDACGTFTLSSDGRRTAAGQTSGPLFDRCWSR